jgi:hypothetical protein
MEMTVDLIDKKYYKYLIFELMMSMPVLIFSIFYCAPSFYTRYGSDIITLIFSEIFMLFCLNFLFFSEMSQYWIVYQKFKHSKLIFNENSVMFDSDHHNKIILREDIYRIEIYEDHNYLSFLGNLLKIYYGKHGKYIFVYQAYDTDLLSGLFYDKIDLVYKKSFLPYFSLINHKSTNLVD